ncbi:PKD domain-containing protein [Methanospirillum stamsii]|nr:PKD domain-containing protein [Methanospirillum stamsii]
MVPHTVQFTNNSKGDISRFEWDFGDGETSSEKDPVHVFRKPGFFSVTLRAYHNSYVSEKVSDQTVNVDYPELLAAITSSSFEGEIPLSISFFSSCLGLVTSYDWDFGDGENSSDPNPVHVYQNPGIYQVSLRVSDGNSNYKAELLNPIQVNPQKLYADFSFLSIDKKKPFSFQFTNKSKGNYDKTSWDFGDGSVSENINDVHEYETPGKYQVTLKICDGKTGSSESVIKEVSTISIPLNADFTHDKSEGQTPLSISFTNNSTGFITSYAWDFGDGSTSSEKNPTHIYENPGKYSVVLIISDGKDFSKSIKKSAIEVSPPGFSADFSCEYSSKYAPIIASFAPQYSNPKATYHWKFGDGEDSFDQNPTHEYKKPGNYSVTLVISQAGIIKEKKQISLIKVPLVLSPQNRNHVELKKSDSEKPVKRSFQDNGHTQQTDNTNISVIIGMVLCVLFIGGVISMGFYFPGSSSGAVVTKPVQTGLTKVTPSPQTVEQNVVTKPMSTGLNKVSPSQTVEQKNQDSSESKELINSNKKLTDGQLIHEYLKELAPLIITWEKDIESVNGIRNASYSQLYQDSLVLETEIQKQQVNFPHGEKRNLHSYYYAQYLQMINGLVTKMKSTITMINDQKNSDYEKAKTFRMLQIDFHPSQQKLKEMFDSCRFNDEDCGINDPLISELKELDYSQNSAKGSANYDSDSSSNSDSDTF